jgi:hypothetical protein
MDFYFFGMRLSISKIKDMPVGITGRYATSDAYLTNVRAPHASQAIEEVLAELSPDSEILLVGSGSEPSFILTYYTINYLDLPRRVWALGCGVKERQPEVAILPPYYKIAGVLFYMRPQPAWLPPGKIVGSDLTYVRVSEVRTWTGYCSQ